MAIGNEFLGHYEQGMSDLEQAIRISPRDSYIGIWYMQMGLELLARGRYADGDRERSQGRQLGVSHGSVLHGACGVLRGGGQGAEAKAALAEAVKLNPKLSFAWFRAHNSAWVDTEPSFREALKEAGLPEE